MAVDDDAEMVRLLAEARQRCEGLGLQVDSIAALVADLDRSAEETESASEEHIDSLCATLEHLTTAANQAAQRVGTEADAATAALTHLGGRSNVARAGLAGLIERTETSAERLDRLLRDLQEDVTTRVTALDAGLAALGTKMTAYGEALAAPVPLLREAIADAGRQLEEACTAHDAAQREWGAATHALFQQLSAQGGALSGVLARLADRHVDAMIVAFNEAADGQTALLATIYQAATERLATGLAPCEGLLVQALAQLSQRAIERGQQLDDADEATGEAPTLVARLAAAAEQARSTRELQR